MKPQRHADAPRTRADKLAEAVRFVWGCRDNVFLSTDAATVATMKGVTDDRDRKKVAEAFDQRREQMRVGV